MKTTGTLLIFLTMFSLNTFAQNLPHKQLRIGGNRVDGVAFSPDGQTLASESGRSIYLWDVSTGKLKDSLERWRYNVDSVAFSPDGQTLASG